MDIPAIVSFATVALVALSTLLAGYTVAAVVDHVIRDGRSWCHPNLRHFSLYNSLFLTLYGNEEYDEECFVQNSCCTKQFLMLL